MGNQPSFNALLKQYMQMRSDFILYMLPLSNFVSGELYFKEKGWMEAHPNPTVIHNNYLKTGEEKIERFKKYDLWHPNEV